MHRASPVASVVLASVVLGPALAATVAVAGPPSVEAAGADARPPSKSFLEMFVAGVVPSPDGHTLVLVNAEEQVLLPLGIGLTEALSIHGRLERREFSRPMTHDLLDHIVTELGGQIVRVQIDDVRDDIFMGTVFIKTGGKIVQFDARPSDAVALAIGSRAPIFVARPVVDRAAIRPEDIPSSPPTAPAGLTKGVLSL